MHEKRLISPPGKYNHTYNIENLIDHIKTNPYNSIGFNLHSLSSKSNYIVLDINDEHVRNRIVEV